jgi:citrate lyase subunit beta/citryl-CoA lyase
LIRFRSLLFVPGNREDMLAKAGHLPADALVPDMEDSVPRNEKERAREIVGKVVKTLAQRGQAIVPRVNALDTGLTAGDMAAVVGPMVYGVSVGKVSSVWEVNQITKILDTIEEKQGIPLGHTKLILWIEGARAVSQAYEIAQASLRIAGVAFGAEDYTNDMEIKRTKEGQEIQFARSMVAVAARAANVIGFDTPYVNFRDNEGLQRDVDIALRLGYKGKFAIHPGQLETINKLFSPSLEEIEHARRVVQAFEEAQSRGSGATSLDGEMIDAPVVKRARTLLALADADKRQQR